MLADVTAENEQILALYCIKYLTFELAIASIAHIGFVED